MVSFPQVSLPKPSNTLPLPTCATCPAHFILLNFINQTILDEKYRSLGSSLCSFFSTPLLHRPSQAQIFSNTLSLCSTLNVTYKVSHPYKTTGKIIILYILIFVFFDGKVEDKRFCTEQQTFPDFNLLLISS